MFSIQRQVSTVQSFRAMLIAGQEEEGVSDGSEEATVTQAIICLGFLMFSRPCDRWLATDLVHTV